MKMTPNLIPSADWVPCIQGLPEPDKFVWIVVGKVVATGLARRYAKEVHMGVWDAENERFKIYPYQTPIISNQVWAWAQMVPPSPPITRSTEAIHQQGESWKDGDHHEFEIDDCEIDDDDDEAFG
jgi:hypothetical protein